MFKSKFKYIIIPAGKLQATATNNVYYLSSIKNNAYLKIINYTFHNQLKIMHHIFKFWPSCYASVMEQNLNPDTLISKKDAARIVETLLVKTLKFQTALPKRNLPYTMFYRGYFQSNCSYEQTFWEEHHWTLSKKTPPWTFLKICFINIFLGQLFHKTALSNSI